MAAQDQVFVQECLSQQFWQENRKNQIRKNHKNIGFL
jgi:hypothetical protein